LITIPELAEKICVTERFVERNIQKLQDRGIVRRVGPAKGGHWEVIKLDAIILSSHLLPNNIFGLNLSRVSSKYCVEMEGRFDKYVARTVKSYESLQVTTMERRESWIKELPRLTQQLAGSEQACFSRAVARQSDIPKKICNKIAEYEVVLLPGRLQLV